MSISYSVLEVLAKGFGRVGWELGAAEKVVRVIDLLWSRIWRKEKVEKGRLSCRR